MYLPRVQDNVFNRRPLLAKLLKKGPKVTGGAQIVVPLIYSGTAGVAYNGYDLLPSTAEDHFTAALFEWKQYTSQAVTLSGREVTLNKGPEQVANIMTASIGVGEQSLRRALQTDLWSTSNGDSSLGITGLPVVFKADRTYGTINSNTAGNEFWDGGANTGTVVMSLATLLTGYLTAATNEEMIAPNFAITSSRMWSRYNAILDANQRYQDTDTAKMGFQNLLFQGNCPVVWDPDCPDDATSATFCFLNLDHFQLYQQSKLGMDFDGWRKPVNQDAMIGYFLAMLQVICDAPRTGYKWTDLRVA
jgi:hypothetical protein